jgi:hypothetical protein
MTVENASRGFRRLSVLVALLGCVVAAANWWLQDADNKWGAHDYLVAAILIFGSSYFVAIVGWVFCGFLKQETTKPER